MRHECRDCMAGFPFEAPSWRVLGLGMRFATPRWQMLTTTRSIKMLAAIILALPLAACSTGGGANAGPDGGLDSGPGRIYSLTFTCGPTGSDECPAGQPCPEVPLSSTSCGDLPAIAGRPGFTPDHEAIPQSTGRPVGCSAALPYENPYYEGEQQTCLCMDLGGIKWVCAL